MTGRRVRVRTGGARFVRFGLTAALLAPGMALLASAVVVPALAGAPTYTIPATATDAGLPAGTLVVVEPAALHDDVHALVIAALAPTVEGAPAGGRVALDGTAGPHNQPAGPRGPVWYTIPYVGFVMDRIDADGRGLLVPLVAVGLVAFAGWLMLSWIASTRRRKAAAMRRARRLQPQSAP